MNQKSETYKLKLTNHINEFCKQIAQSSQILAISTLYNSSLESNDNSLQILLIIKDFQPRILTKYVDINNRKITIFVVDQWIFERDVDRGLLGEAFASSLIFPYKPFLGQNFLYHHEIFLKKRIILELLENLVQSYPELATQIKIQPEFFMYEAVLERVRIFPPLVYSLSTLLTKTSSKEATSVKNGYIKAILELEKEEKLFFSENKVSLKKEFIKESKKPKTYIKNLRKKAPRGIFTSFFSVWLQLFSFFIQKTNVIATLKKINGINSVETNKPLINPQKFVQITTNNKAFSLADGVDMITFAKKHLLVDNKKNIKSKVIGGVLNDVYLIQTSSDHQEKKIIAKRFRDWSGFKWFPLSLWSLGVRNLSVLGRSRLARECEINGFLVSKGFRVPKILHVSHKNRLVFMEYVDGENLSVFIKRFLKLNNSKKTKIKLTIMQEVGKLFARVHLLNVTLGDTKPENILVDSNGELFLLDFEQASHGGDKAWDLAVFLYFLGHYFSIFSDKKSIEALVNAFLSGYIKNGGKIGDIKKAGSSKYTRLFSIFIMPYVLYLISNICKKIDIKK